MSERLRLVHRSSARFLPSGSIRWDDGVPVEYMPLPLAPDVAAAVNAALEPFNAELGTVWKIDEDGMERPTDPPYAFIRRRRPPLSDELRAVAEERKQD